MLKNDSSRQSGWTVATFASVGVHLAAGLGMYLAPTIGMADGSNLSGVEQGIGGGVIQLSPVGSEPALAAVPQTPPPASVPQNPPVELAPVIASEPPLVAVPVVKMEPEPVEVELGKDDGVKGLKQWIASDKIGENRSLPGPEEQPGLSRRAGVPKRASGDPNASPNAGGGAAGGADAAAMPTSGGPATPSSSSEPQRAEDQAAKQTPSVSPTGASDPTSTPAVPEEPVKPLPTPPNPQQDRAPERGEQAGSPRPEVPSAAGARTLAPQSAPELPKPNAITPGPRAVEVDANRSMVPDLIVPPRPSVPVGPDRQGDTPDGKVVLPADLKPAAATERNDRPELPIGERVLAGDVAKGSRQADAPREPSAVTLDEAAATKPIEAQLPRTKAEFDLLLPEAVKLVRRNGSPPLILSPDLLDAATAAAKRPQSSPSADAARAAARPAGQPSPSAQGGQPGSPGNPGNLGNPGEAGDNGGNVVGDAGLQSDRDSDAFSVKVGEYRAGKVEAGDGIEIRTVRPEFGLMARTLAFPSPPKIEVIFGRDGEVKRARVVRSSGYSVDVDEPILNAVYQWRAGGKALKDLPDKPSAELRLNLTVFLR